MDEDIIFDCSISLCARVYPPPPPFARARASAYGAWRMTQRRRVAMFQRLWSREGRPMVFAVVPIARVLESKHMPPKSMLGKRHFMQ
jgi:predicted lipoprotein with Yx(FWY)xxD motif